MFLVAPFLNAQQTEFWLEINDAKIGISKLQRKVHPKKYKSFHLDLEGVKSKLKSAPDAQSNLAESKLIIAFPDEKGQLKQFRVKEFPVMNAALARKFPNNKSYTGIAIDGSNKRISFSLNELGLNATISETNGNAIILNPMRSGNENYKVYLKKDLIGSADFNCISKDLAYKSMLSLKSAKANDGNLRTYRLALAANGNYSQYHLEQFGYTGSDETIQKAIVMAELTKVVTKLNAVYEQELAIRFELVADNDRIVFLDPSDDPYNNGDSGQMLIQNQNTLDKVIFSDNYDIGHLFSTTSEPVAILGTVCVDGVKAQGISGMNNPIDEIFYYNVVSHEFGHQFGANHTFNGTTGSCNGLGQLVEKTAVEPGSGSTLMAYAGYCDGQNIQANSDLYFHGVNIEEINFFLNSGIDCASRTELQQNKNRPEVAAGDNRIIPIGTAFKLVGEATDDDGDILSYCWEQIDAGRTAVPPIENAARGALYRSYEPVLESVRYFPNLKTLRNNFLNATWEVTPMVERDLNFRLTVRDNNLEAGLHAFDDLMLSVTNEAGPFIILSQSTSNEVWTPGTQETVNWDVAGTDSNGVNVSKVNILLSTDGGLSYPFVLASNISNNGSNSINVPEMDADQCLIMVEAVDNVFFAVNSKFFSIGSFDITCNQYGSDDIPHDIVSGTSNIIRSENTILEEQKVKDLSVSVKLKHSFISDLFLSLESPSGTVIDLLKRPCNNNDKDIDVTFNDEGDMMVCVSFAPSISGNILALSNLSQFYGENANGAWKLIVADMASGDDGVLESWSLEICSSKAVLAVNQFELAEFKVFPNPSDGKIQIAFNSEEFAPVEVLLFDLLGRKSI